MVSSRAPDELSYRSLTVGEAVADPALAGARVVAGLDGLAREVADVGVLDLGEMDALRPGQLVLSNAYPLQEVDLQDLWGRLVAAGVSAFGVKLSGFWTEMPADLVAAADAAHVPLLELPPGRFEELVNPVLTAVAERQAERLRRSADLHHALTAAALSDESLASIAQVLEQALDRPVGIYNRRDELLASTGPVPLWEAPELVHGRLAVQEATDLVVRSTTYLAAPIFAAGQRYGTICVAGVSADDSFARGAVAQAALVTAMRLVGRHSIEAVHRRFERALLDDLADGRLTAQDARRRAMQIDWPLRRPYVVLVAQRRSPATVTLAAAPPLPLTDAELQAFARSLSLAPFETRLLPRHSGIAIVLHLADRDEFRQCAESLSERLLSTREVSWAGTELAIGVSRPRRQITEFAPAFHEASLTAGTSMKLARDEARIDHFEDLGLCRLFAHVSEPEKLRAMAREAIGPLAETDTPANVELLDTLLVLLARNMRLGDTADDLYFHYNTVRHRLGRLRKLLGDRLDSPQSRLSLFLALSALRATTPT